MSNHFKRVVSPLAFVASFIITLFLMKILHLIRPLLILIFLALFFFFWFLFSNLFSRYRVAALSTYLDEALQLESFLSPFSDNLRLGLSPEFSLLRTFEYSHNSFSESFYPLCSSLIGSGNSASKVLESFGDRLFFPENKRILYLFSKAIAKDSVKFGKIASDIVYHLKEVRILKGKLDSMLSAMRLRITLLTIVSSAVLSFFSKLSPLLFSLNFIAHSISNSTVVAGDLSIFLFISLGLLSFFDTYLVSLMVFHGHPFLLSSSSVLVYILTYLFLPNFGD